MEGPNGNVDTGARVKFLYDTIAQSNVPVCYSGRAFPFEIPSCRLSMDNNPPVPTYQHDLAHYYLNSMVLNAQLSMYSVWEDMPNYDVPFQGEQSEFVVPVTPQDLLTTDTWYDFDSVTDGMAATAVTLSCKVCQTAVPSKLLEQKP